MAEITYQGLSRVPDDYTSTDGQAALSLNLVPENGSLQPIFPPSLIFTLPEGHKVAYIHKTTAFTHYIITRVDDKVNYTEKGEEESHPAIYWLDSDNVPEDKKVTLDDLIEFTAIEGTEIKTIQAVGNTLIVVTKEAMNYYLWKYIEEEDEKDSHYGYAYLGTHLPELDLSFGLQGEIWRDSDEDHVIYEKVGDWSYGNATYYGFEVTLAEELEESELYDDLSDENKATVTEQVLAKVNKYIADYSTNKGRFLYPFFVRYAYRLYDDSLTMHSAPILMLTNTACAPSVFICQFHRDDSKYKSLYCSVVGVTHAIDYRIESIDNYRQLKNNWGDIVKSVDIFVSAPLYNYDQSGEVKRFIELPEQIDPTDESRGYTVCRPFFPADQMHDRRTSENYGSTSTPFQWEGGYGTNEGVCLNNYCRITTDMFFYYSFATTVARVELPTKSEDEVKEEIRSCCNFYLLKSINVEDLAEYDDTGEMVYSRIKLEVAEDYLQSLVNRELMTDDYDSHDTLVPSFAYNYNNRLDIANITKTLYHGYTPSALFCYGNAYAETDGGAWEWTSSRQQATLTSIANSYTQVDCKIYTYINQDSKKIIVESETDKTHAPITYVGGKYLFVYYPNTNAYKALIDMGDSAAGAKFEVKLERHDFLNGAFYFGGWQNPDNTTESSPSASVDQTVSVANKLYLSEINNPFFFPVEQIVTVGTGKILGIATAAKPLSQGQFGSFPLYAFCDDGVWALSVNNEGIYSAVQPITRDVCINEKAITQLDSSVLFPTDRGIMQISGNAATCITDIFDSDDIYPIEKLPHYEQLLRLASSGEWCKDGEEPFSIVPITDFLATAVILYDYTNQRIYVCNDGLNYAYVLSTKSQQWGMATVDISSVVNSYPDAYAMTPDGQFVDFTHPDTSAPAPCMYVTRPLKLDGPNILKTVTAVIQRGFFDKSHVQSAIFGSRDLLHYHTIRTSQTHELRAFAGTPFKYFRVAVLAQLSYGESIFGATINSTPRLTNKAR